MSTGCIDQIFTSSNDKYYIRAWLFLIIFLKINHFHNYFFPGHLAKCQVLLFKLTLGCILGVTC